MYIDHTLNQRVVTSGPDFGIRPKFATMVVILLRRGAVHTGVRMTTRRITDFDREQTSAKRRFPIGSP